MSDERPMIHIRLPKRLIKAIDHVSVDIEADRARTIERVLEVGLRSFDQGHPA